MMIVLRETAMATPTTACSPSTSRAKPIYTGPPGPMIQSPVALMAQSKHLPIHLFTCCPSTPPASSITALHPKGTTKIRWLTLEAPAYKMSRSHSMEGHPGPKDTASLRSSPPSPPLISALASPGDTAPGPVGNHHSTDHHFHHRRIFRPRWPPRPVGAPHSTATDDEVPVGRRALPAPPSAHRRTIDATEDEGSVWRPGSGFGHRLGGIPT